MTHTPNLERLGNVLKALGSAPSVSWQSRENGSGFFTATYWPAGDKTRCAIGQGDTLPKALEEARRDAAALLAEVNISDLEAEAA